MQYPYPLSKRVGLLVAVALLVLSCGLLTAQTLPDMPSELREDTQNRWAARLFADYRVTVRVRLGADRGDRAEALAVYPPPLIGSASRC